MPTLKQLRYASAVAQFGHFGKAAAHCSVSQPALSMQIRDLEQELQATLFERRPSGVVVTEIGQNIVRRADKILTDVRDLSDFAQRQRGLLVGHLSIGIIPTLAHTFCRDC